MAVPIVLVMALAAWAIARYTAGPLEMLTRAAAAFGRGDLGAPVEVRRGGELGALADALRTMARDLHSSRAQIETHNQALEQRVADRTADLEGCAGRSARFDRRARAAECGDPGAIEPGAAGA